MRIERGLNAAVRTWWAGIAIACLAWTSAAQEQTSLRSNDVALEPAAKLIALKHRDPESVVRVLKALPVQLAADAHTNQLLVVGRPEQIEQIEALVEKLDLPAMRHVGDPEPELRLFHLKHRRADELMECLADMLSPAGRISVDLGSETLLVRDLPAIHAELAAAICELDVADACTLPQPIAMAAPPRRYCEVRSVLDSHDERDTLTISDANGIIASDTAASATHADSMVQLHVTVCEVHRAALDRLGDESPMLFANPLAAALRRGQPTSSVVDAADAAECVTALANADAIRVICEPTIRTQSGREARFTSISDLDSPLVVEDDAPEMIAAHVNGLGVSLKCVPTIISSRQLLLRMSSRFGPQSTDDDEPAAESPHVAAELTHDQVLVVSGRVRTPTWVEDKPSGLGKVFSRLLGSKRLVMKESELMVIVSPEVVPAARPVDMARQPGAVAQ